jgi:formate hydrogenlyase subunit 3/multisubunit Na+/H+ antiporter MnhD subunit
MTTISAFFRIDALSMFVATFIVFFFAMTAVYSLGSMKGKKGLGTYYLYLLLTTAASLVAVFANNLIVFVAF